MPTEIHSITIEGWPLASPVRKIWTTLGWRSRARVMASRSARWRLEGVLSPRKQSTFTATSRLRLVSTARYTSPIVPLFHGSEVGQAGNRRCFLISSFPSLENPDRIAGQAVEHQVRGRVKRRIARLKLLAGFQFLEQPFQSQATALAFLQMDAQNLGFRVMDLLIQHAQPGRMVRAAGGGGHWPVPVCSSCKILSRISRWTLHRAMYAVLIRMPRRAATSRPD